MGPPMSSNLKEVFLGLARRARWRARISLFFGVLCPTIALGLFWQQNYGLAAGNLLVGLVNLMFALTDYRKAAADDKAARDLEAPKRRVA